MSSQPIRTSSPTASTGAVPARRRNASPASRPTRAKTASTALSRLFSQPEWELLVRLPGRVLVAAAGTDDGRPRQAVAEGLAGIEAIAAGRASPSALVRDIVSAIYAETDERSAAEFADTTGVAAVLDECRAAGRLLVDRSPVADAAAYRRWVTGIAATVCAARTGRGSGFARMPVSVTQQALLAELDRALEASNPG
jgi:hypothetical protein